VFYTRFGAANPNAWGPRTAVVTAPDIAVIGFIPHLREIPPGSGYDVYAGVKRAGMKFLFRSGNYTPVELDGPSDLVRYLDARGEYRGALLMSNISLSLCADGTPAEVRFEGLTDDVGVGYTPLQRLWRPTPALPLPPPGSHHWRKQVWRYDQGVWPADDPRWRVDFEPDCAILTHWQDFRICGLGNLASAFFTGQFAPFAWIQVEYKIFSNGRREAWVMGSHVPSLLSMVAWQAVDLQDMTQNDFAEVDGFITATPNTRAPPRLAWRVL
jgi:hypothetical protein